jgi:hypothetical protein
MVDLASRFADGMARIAVGHTLSEVFHVCHAKPILVVSVVSLPTSSLPRRCRVWIQPITGRAVTGFAADAERPIEVLPAVDRFGWARSVAVKAERRFVCGLTVHWFAEQ